MSRFASSLLAGGAALLIGMSASYAANANSSSIPFDGFYAGMHAGYGWADSEVDYAGNYNVAISDYSTDGDYSSFDGSQSMKSKGALLGGQFGFNLVGESGLLVGAELNGSWTNIAGDTEFIDGDVEASVSQTIGAIALAQAKLGFANETMALYALGGLAMGHLKTDYRLYSYDEIVPVSLEDGQMKIADFGDSKTMTGWTVGAGAEAMVHENVSFGVSYNYIRLNGESIYHVDEGSIVTLTGEMNTDASHSLHLVKASINYNF